MLDLKGKSANPVISVAGENTPKTYSSGISF